MDKIALVAGGTGLVGNLLLKELTQCANYHDTIAVVRGGSPVDVPGITSKEIDFDLLGSPDKSLVADVVFCCLGTTIRRAKTKEQFYKVDFTYPYLLAQTAKANHCRQFHLISSIGASVNSLFYYTRVKGEIEQAICSLDIPSIHIYRPSLLLGDRQQKRAGEQVGAALSKLFGPALVGSMRRYRAIEAQTVARAMIQASLQNSEGIHIYESEVINRLGESLSLPSR